MRTIAVSLLLALTPVGLEHARAGDPPTEDLGARVEQAVERGVAWLRKRQDASGSFGTDFDNSSKVPRPEGYAGHRLGRLTLALYTLAHCRVPPDDPAFGRGVAVVRRDYKMLLAKDAHAGEGLTYTVSLILMLMHEVFAHTPLIFDAEGNPEGDREAPSASNPLGMPGWAQTIVRDCMKWLQRVAAPNALYGYPTPPIKYPRGAKVDKALKKWLKANGGWDHSNTQFALLGLWAGTRLGHRVDKRILEKLADALLATQAPDGPVVRRQWDPDDGKNPSDARYAGPEDRARGFSYRLFAPRFTRGRQEGEPPPLMESGSMTAGGLSSLLVVKAMLSESDALDAKREQALDRGIWDAMAWLAKNFRVDGNPATTNPLPDGSKPNSAAHGYWPLYYLYGLERACEIAGKSHVGGHDWYAEGAEQILRWQAEDGTFDPTVPPVPDAMEGRDVNQARLWKRLPNVCFALLFLERAALRPRAPLVDTRRPEDQK